MATNALDSALNTPEVVGNLTSTLVDVVVVALTALASEGTTAVDLTAVEAAVDAIVATDLYA